MSAPMLHAAPQRMEPTRNRPMPRSITGLRPKTSARLPDNGTGTARAGRETENSHGNSAKPPRLATIDGTAVGMTVAAMATRAVDSMMPMSTGPRSDRKPTPDDPEGCSSLTGSRLGPRRESDRAVSTPHEYPFLPRVAPKPDD